MRKISTLDLMIVVECGIKILVFFLLCALIGLIFAVTVRIWTITTFAKTDDLSEENSVSINVSTDEEKSLVEENRGVVAALESALPKESYVEPVEPDWIEYVVTAYCGCEKCCGKWASIAPLATASGWGAQAGVTIAADESYPFGTRLYLEGLGERVVMDRGSAIVGNHLDLYFDTHEEACEWGMRTVRGYVK